MSHKQPLSRMKTRKHFAFDYNISLGIPFYIVAIALIALPIGLMVLYSFNDGTAGGTNIFQIRFTFQNYLDFFAPGFITTLLNSMWIAAVSTLITLLIAYPLCIVMIRSKLRIRILVLSIVTAPMWLNAFLRANAIRQLLIMINPNLIGTHFAIILGTVYLFLPFMVLPIYTILQKIDKSYIEGAQDLGANSFQTFLKVTLPLSMSGVISGIMLVFLPAATSIIIPVVLADGASNLFFVGPLIEEIVNEHGSGVGIGFGSAIAIMVGMLLLLFVWLIRKTDRYGGGLDEKN